MPDAVAIVEVTLGEVYRLLTTQGQKLDTMSSIMEKKPSWDDIDRMEEARIERSKLHAAKEQKQDEAISALEEANRVLMRTVIVSILTGLISLCVGIGVAVVVAGLKSL